MTASRRPDRWSSSTSSSSTSGARARDAGRDAFVECVIENTPNYERIIAINRGRTTAAEDGATELELDPNSCAAE
ncbi:MAG: hypothetical protein ACI8UR_000006 [Natronomonas sp.]|jgi:hypothetical protein